MFLSLLAIHRTCKANEVEQNKHLTGSTVHLYDFEISLRISTYGDISNCASKELRILILSADYQFGVILVLNNLGPGYMIPLSRDELIGGIILMYGNKSPSLNKSSRHHEKK